ncbi:MAG: CoA-binding protein [Nitrososphaerota archaeon]|nr:CoA-binding protein [Aigarchaeota archaeon]MDW8076756.1 CoA-binding protein [Nitrososphaerota archaeon]
MVIEEKDGLSDEEIKDILSKYKVIAVIGMSRDARKPGHYVPKFLMKHGYKIIPVNPNSSEINVGNQTLKSYKSLLDIQEDVDIANVFRRPEDVPPVAEDAIRKGVKVFWMQEGIYNKEAVEKLRKAGIIVVWDRCMMKEYSRLFNVKPFVPTSKL